MPMCDKNLALRDTFDSIIKELVIDSDELRELMFAMFVKGFEVGSLVGKHEAKKLYHDLMAIHMDIRFKKNNLTSLKK